MIRSLILVTVIAAGACAARLTKKEELKNDLQEWTSSIQGRDREQVEQHLRYLKFLVDDGIERDEKLFRLLVPLVKTDAAKRGLLFSFTPLDQSAMSSLVRSLPTDAAKLDAGAPVAEAIRWVNQRNNRESSPVTEEGLNHLKVMKELLIKQLEAMRNVEAGISAMNALVAVQDGTEKGVTIEQLMESLGNHTKGWRWIGASTYSTPLLYLERQMRLFAHDWDNRSHHVH